MTTKPKKTLKISALLLIVCLISTVMLSGTFAKYTSEYAGEDTALVARWSFTSDTMGDGTSDEPADLPLFDHLYDTHINKTAADGTTFIIAPGVGDEFTLKMDYIADVDADVKITIDDLEDSAAVPVEYSVDGTTWVTRANLAEALAVKIAGNLPADSITDPTEGDQTFRIAAVANDSPVNIAETIKWKWRYAKGEAGSAYGAQTDVNDTDLGKASNNAGLDRTSYGIKVTLNATQVIPANFDMAAISGTPEVDETLTAGALTPVAATVSYQWQKSDTLGGGYVNIAGATANTYVVDGAYVNKFIRVVATGTGSTLGSAVSGPRGPIAAATP
ncbi:MAG: hypothetical protein PHV03_07390 [Desulfitobacteriaceae bacterium]|nr:hypothetical protein [Desulfitobacteriaceae bacterium]MDD4400504.1 hypothetical protein [Desulfitobacteriaceae bacterium]